MIRVAAITLLASIAALGADATTAMDDVRALHAAGVAGNRTAVTDCIARLEAVLEREPSNQVARAWLGSALTLRSRDLGIGPAKLETLKRGGRLMDEAVAASDDPEVRLVRAINSGKLPAIFGRKNVAREDFRFLLERVHDPAGPMDPQVAQAIFLHAGDFLSQEGRKAESLAAWRDGLQIQPGSVLARELRARLSSHSKS